MILSHCRCCFLPPASWPPLVPQLHQARHMFCNSTIESIYDFSNFHTSLSCPPCSLVSESFSKSWFTLSLQFRSPLFGVQWRQLGWLPRYAKVYVWILLFSRRLAGFVAHQEANNNLSFLLRGKVQGVSDGNLWASVTHVLAQGHAWSVFSLSNPLLSQQERSSHRVEPGLSQKNKAPRDRLSCGSW